MSNPGEEDQNEEPNSSESSCSTITLTATTTSSSSSSSITSSVSDTDDNHDCSQPHRQCHKSNSHSRCLPGGGDEGNIPDRKSEMIDWLNPTEGQNCDIKIGTSCQSAALCQVPSAINEYARQKCKQYSKDETTSQPKSKALQQSSVPGSSLGKSTSDRCSNSGESSLRIERLEKAKSTTAATLGLTYSNLSSNTSNLTPATSTEVQQRRILKPAPSPSPSLSTIDTNNNKSANSSSSVDSLSHRRTNFSKSSSGSRLITKSRSNVCDCLSLDCSEKRHSNRRRFIEHYYNSRTQLPSADRSSSSFNISTPLNKLSECDAITRRLLSSPIRTTTLVESPTQRVQMSEVDRSRRASLGTNTMADQVFLYTSNTFASMKSNSEKCQDDSNQNPKKCDDQSAQASGDHDIKLKQQQGRSFSVCHEDTLGSKIKNTSSNHSANLNRAVSLACESGSSPTTRQLLTIIPLFGCDIKSLEQFTKMESIFPPVINSAVDYILARGINSIGIFRKSGVKSRILSLRQRIEANQDMKFDELNRNNEISIYDIADLVKMWFRELKPVPLMKKELIKLISSFLKSTSAIGSRSSSSSMLHGNSSQQDSFCTGSQSDSAGKPFDSSLKTKIDSIITPTHKALLLRALNFLSQISKRCETNQMTSQNLAICLTPSLCETESDQNSILVDQKVLEYCIDNHLALFGRQHRP